MKKLISLFAAASMLTLSAVAVQAEGLENYVPTNNVYSFDYEVGAANAGEYYGMVAVEGEGEGINTTDVEKFVYIDQATADSTGKISFTNFAPKGLAADAEGYKVSTIFIGGKGFETAQAIGVLREANWTEGPSTIVISGKLLETFAGANRAAKVIVQNADGSVVTEVAPNADGIYEISVAPAASYNVVLTKDGFLKFTITGVPAEANVALKDVDITDFAGDVDSNNSIAATDLGKVLNNYGLSATALAEADAFADLDANGSVAATDLGKVLNNYGKEGITEAYSAE